MRGHKYGAWAWIVGPLLADERPVADGKRGFRVLVWSDEMPDESEAFGHVWLVTDQRRPWNSPLRKGDVVFAYGRLVRARWDDPRALCVHVGPEDVLWRVREAAPRAVSITRR